MSTIRSYGEMERILLQRWDEKGSILPINLEYRQGDQSLKFFGSKHNNDTEDNEGPMLEKSWQGFLENGNPSKLAVIERPITPDELNGKSRDQALTAYGEAGLTAWLARESGVPFICGEPDFGDQIRHLKDDFTGDQIVTWLFASQMFHWATQDIRNVPEWEQYARATVDNYDRQNIADEPLNADKVMGWLGRMAGKEVDPHDTYTLADLVAPTLSPIAASSGRYRDEHLLGVISNEWRLGKDLFIVYGYGHVITLEPALKRLTGEAAQADWDQIWGEA